MKGRILYIQGMEEPLHGYKREKINLKRIKREIIIFSRDCEKKNWRDACFVIFKNVTVSAWKNLMKRDLYVKYNIPHMCVCVCVCVCVYFYSTHSNFSRHTLSTYSLL